MKPERIRINTVVSHAIKFKGGVILSLGGIIVVALAVVGALVVISWLVGR